MPEVIIYKPKGLKLKYLPNGKIYTFYDNTEILKYNNEKFEIVKSQDKLFQNIF